MQKGPNLKHTDGNAVPSLIIKQEIGKQTQTFCTALELNNQSHKKNFGAGRRS